jgi:hypothetical protein
MEGGADTGADIGVSEADEPTDRLTDTEDLQSGIAQRYGLSPQGYYTPGVYSPGMYQSRINAFNAVFQVAPPPKVRERRHPFVLTTFLKNVLGVNTYQPTGYSVQKNLAGDGNDNQIISSVQFQNPIDTFGPQKPILDQKKSSVAKPEEVGRLLQEDDLRRRSMHVSEGKKDKYDYPIGE